MASVFFGIDPGKTGGIARITCRNVPAAPTPPRPVMETWPLNDLTERDVWDLFVEEVMPHEGDAHVFIEYVHAGGTMGARSLWTFARSYQMLRSSLIACEMTFEEVRPTEWQGGMDCRTKGDKAVSRAKAQQLWPKHKVTNAVADAMLIAEYCRRMRSGH